MLSKAHPAVSVPNIQYSGLFNRTLQKFMKNRLLVPILEGKLTLPDEFDVNKFDYSILEDVLSVEGLGDILSDIPDKIRDKLVDLKVTNEDRVGSCDLCTKQTKTYVVIVLLKGQSLHVKAWGSWAKV